MRSVDDLIPFEPLREAVAAALLAEGLGAADSLDGETLPTLGRTLAGDRLVLGPCTPGPVLLLLNTLPRGAREVVVLGGRAAKLAARPGVLPPEVRITKATPAAGSGRCVVVLDAANADRSDEAWACVRSAAPGSSVVVLRSLRAAARAWCLAWEAAGVGPVVHLPSPAGVSVLHIDHPERLTGPAGEPVRAAWASMGADAPRWRRAALAEAGLPELEAHAAALARAALASMHDAFAQPRALGEGDAREAAAALLAAYPPQSGPARFAWSGREAEVALVGSVARGETPPTAAAVTALRELRELAFWCRGWREAGGETRDLVLGGSIDAREATPFPVRSAGEYGDYYRLRGRRARHADPAEAVGGEALWRHPIPAAGGTGHVVRRQLAVGVVETVLGVLAAERGEDSRGGPVRWLDLGCAYGLFANAVRAPAGVVLEVVGVETNERSVEVARRNAPPGRRFVLGDAVDVPAEVAGQRWDVVSAFELIEHLPDPVGFVRRCAALGARYVIGASPLGDPRPVSPALAHLWSFTRGGYEAVFRAAGLGVSVSVETRAGSHLGGGHDWLTVVGSAGGPMPRSL